MVYFSNNARLRQPPKFPELTVSLCNATCDFLRGGPRHKFTAKTWYVVPSGGLTAELHHKTLHVVVMYRRREIRGS